MMRILKKLLRAIAAAVLVPVLLFEEWGWEPLARALPSCRDCPSGRTLKTACAPCPPGPP